MPGPRRVFGMFPTGFSQAQVVKRVRHSMKSPEPIRQEMWSVYRQDDNGNRFVVSTQLNREEAELLVAEFEARGHKQVYWVEPELT